MDEIRRYFPDWEILEKLGQGTYGIVYKIQNRHNQTCSALKVIRIPRDDSEKRSLYAAGMDMASVRSYYEKATHYVISEIDIMQTLRDSRHVVGIEDYLIVEDPHDIGWTIMIRMELLTSLTEYTMNHELGLKDIAKIGLDLTDALMHCEQKHIIHRDVKPANVLVSRDGEFKLSDFGIARQMEATLSASTQAGSENYMAPEIFKNEKYDQTVDIYSLGLMLYQMLNHGRMPFMPDYPATISPDDISRARMIRLRGDALKAPYNHDPQLTAIVLKAASYEPEDRYQSPAFMHADLENYYKKYVREERRRELLNDIDHYQRHHDDEHLLESYRTYRQEINPNAYAKELAQCLARLKRPEAIDAYRDYLSRYQDKDASLEFLDLYMQAKRHKEADVLIQTMLLDFATERVALTPAELNRLGAMLQITKSSNAEIAGLVEAISHLDGTSEHRIREIRKALGLVAQPETIVPERVEEKKPIQRTVSPSKAEQLAAEIRKIPTSFLVIGLCVAIVISALGVTLGIRLMNEGSYQKAMEKGDYARAIELIEKKKRTSSSSEYDTALDECNYELAKQAKEAKRYEEALSYLEKRRTENMRSQYDELSDSCYLALAQDASDAAEYDKALGYLEKRKTSTYQDDFSQLTDVVHYHQAREYAEHGDYERAYEYLENNKNNEAVAYREEIKSTYFNRKISQEVYNEYLKQIESYGGGSYAGAKAYHQMATRVASLLKKLENGTPSNSEYLKVFNEVPSSKATAKSWANVLQDKFNDNSNQVHDARAVYFATGYSKINGVDETGSKPKYRQVSQVINRMYELQQYWHISSYGIACMLGMYQDMNAKISMSDHQIRILWNSSTAGYYLCGKNPDGYNEDNRKSIQKKTVNSCKVIRNSGGKKTWRFTIYHPNVKCDYVVFDVNFYTKGRTWQYTKKRYVVYNPSVNGKTTWTVKVDSKYNYIWGYEVQRNYRND